MSNAIVINRQQAVRAYGTVLASKSHIVAPAYSSRWGTYNVVRKMPGGEKMVAMTRVLHRTTPDEIMDEVRAYTAWTALVDGARALHLLPYCL